LNIGETRFKFEGNPQVVFKRYLNMADKLINSKIPTNAPVMNFSDACGRNCQVCPFMKYAESVISLDGKETIKIVGQNSCRTTNVVYLLICNKCGFQYGGQTETRFSVRFASHKWQSRQSGYALNDHFLKTGHCIEDFGAFVLKKFQTGPEREVFECFLIKKFNLVKGGINKDEGAFSNIKIWS
jgi:hypothetical protein